MSARTGSFTLRSFVQPEDGASQVIALKSLAVPQLGTPAAQPSEASPEARGLRFDFSSLQPRKQSADSKDCKPALNGTQLSMTFRNAYDSVRDSSRADVMRLTVMADDLSVRYKRASERASVAEANLKQVHATMLTERSANAANMKTLCDKLDSFKASNAQLAEKIKLLSVNECSNKAKFESAVKAALQAEETRCMMASQVEDMRAQITERDEKLKNSTDALIDLNHKNAEIEKAANMFEQQNKAATLELKRARDDLNIATSARDSALLELESMVRKHNDLQQVLDSVQSELVTARQLQEAASDTSAPVPEEPGVVAVQEAPEPAPEAPQNEASEADKQQEIVVTACPVKMYNRYEKMRQRVLKLSAKLESLQRDDAPCQETLDRVKSARDRAYVRAVVLKSNYDKLFGTYQSEVPASQAEEQSARQETAQEQRTLPVSSHEPHIKRFVVGDVPPAKIADYRSSSAAKHADKCVLGSAFSLSKLDCDIKIHAANVSAGAEEKKTQDLMSMDDEEVATEPIGKHDVRDDMVSAVVADLKAFLAWASSEEEGK